MITDPHEVFFASAWFKSRPPHVQLMFRKYTGKYVILDGGPGRFHLIGVSENIKHPEQCGLWLSAVNPGRDFERAFAERFWVCGSPACLAKITTEEYPWLSPSP